MRRGPLLMILASLSFTIMVGFVKVARAELDAFEVIVWRSLVSVPLAAVFVRRIGLSVRRPGLLLVRCLLGFGAMTCFFTAAKGLSLADLSLITKLQPVLVAVLAPVVLGASERSGWRLWVVVALGLVGCSLLVAPDLAVGSVFGLWAVAATVFSATAHLAVRRLGATEHPAVIVFWFQIAAGLFAFAATPLSTGAMITLPRTGLWPALLAVGLFAGTGQLLMTRAYQLDRAAPVAAASYVGPLFGLVGDVLFFATWPTPLALVGGSLVVGAGLLLLGERRAAGAASTLP